jgi:hypothetical protein
MKATGAIPVLPIPEAAALTGEPAALQCPASHAANSSGVCTPYSSTAV